MTIQTTIAIVVVSIALFRILANKIDSDELVKTAISAAAVAVGLSIRALSPRN